MAQSVAAGAFTPPARGGGPAGAGAGHSSPTCRRSAACSDTQADRATSDIKMDSGCPSRPASSRRGATKLGQSELGRLERQVPRNRQRRARRRPRREREPAGGRRARGYAAAGHNTGHEGDSSYAPGPSEKIKDFGYRSTHEMTVASKALIKAYYGTGPKLSFMAEGGGGTIAALSSAQRYRMTTTRSR